MADVKYDETSKLVKPEILFSSDNNIAPLKSVPFQVTNTCVSHLRSLAVQSGMTQLDSPVTIYTQSVDWHTFPS